MKKILLFILLFCSYTLKASETDNFNMSQLFGDWNISNGNTFNINKLESNERGLYATNTKGEFVCLYQPMENDAFSTQLDYMCVGLEAKLHQNYYFDVVDNKLNGYYCEGDATTCSLAFISPLFSGYVQKITGLNNPNSWNSSTYQLIQWAKRNSNVHYCLDIADDNGNNYEDLSPIECGLNFHHFSPADYVKNVMNGSLPSGFAFRWRIWSSDVDANGANSGIPNYAGNGYEGRVVVP